MKDDDSPAKRSNLCSKNKDQLQDLSYELASTIVGSFGSGEVCETKLEEVYLETQGTIDTYSRAEGRTELYNRFSRDQIGKWQQICSAATTKGKDILSMVVDEQRYGINRHVAKDVISSLETFDAENIDKPTICSAIDIATRNANSLDYVGPESKQQVIDDIVSLESQAKRQLSQEHIQAELKRLENEHQSYLSRREEALNDIKKLDEQQRQRDEIRIEILSAFPTHKYQRNASLSLSEEPCLLRESVDDSHHECSDGKERYTKLRSASPCTDQGLQAMSPRVRELNSSTDGEDEEIQAACSDTSRQNLLQPIRSPAFASNDFFGGQPSFEGTSTSLPATATMLKPLVRAGDDTSLFENFECPEDEFRGSTKLNETLNDEASVTAPSAIESNHNSSKSCQELFDASSTRSGNDASSIISANTEYDASSTVYRSAPDNTSLLSCDVHTVSSLDSGILEEEDDDFKVPADLRIEERSNSCRKVASANQGGLDRYPVSAAIEGALTRHRFFDDEQEYPKQGIENGTVLVVPEHGKLKRRHTHTSNAEDTRGGLVDEATERLRVVGLGSSARLMLLGDIEEEPSL